MSSKGKDRLDLPHQATPARRLVHVLVSVVGWVLFVYWWWIVFGRVSRREVLFTCIFIAVTTAVSVLVTSLWSMHNRRLHRQRAQRQQTPHVDEDYSLDVLSRSVTFEEDITVLREKPRLYVELISNRKFYRAARSRNVGQVDAAGGAGNHA